jgi:tetratricopeptide (TPR) repeat protein/predicted Ser/Thr protein kinase
MATIISRRYEVLGQLGQGGMGVVYKVRHTVLETILALKVLPAYFMENQDIVARFTREARVVARLHHPNIVRVLDLESDADLNFYYFIMEYIEGETLDQYVRKKGPLPLPEIVEIGKQIASALEYAHNYHPSIVHRDIKPANIMIEAHSNRVVVMDFGIAKERGDTDGTKTGAVIGTLKYASPEQLRHEPLEGSADVYSLGMVLYEMFTGKQFFAGLDEIAVLGKVLDNAQDNEPHFDRPAPAPFVNLVTKAIAKTRTQRYQRMADLLRALETCQAQERQEELKVEDIEKRVREREEERQLQAQVQESRAQAAPEGAAEWAAAPLQQGLAREESARRSLREHDLPAAQQAYQDAIALSDQAREEAQKTMSLRKAERIRQEMAAKAEASTARQQSEDACKQAERAGVRTRFAAAFAAAQRLVEQGQEKETQEEFSQARDCYQQARQQFFKLVQETERQVERGHAQEGKQKVTNAKGVAAALAPRGVPLQWQEVPWQETDEEQVWQAGELNEQAGPISDRARVEAASAPKTVLSPPRRTTRQSVMGKWAGWAAMVLGTVMVSAVVIWFVPVREKIYLSIPPPEGNVLPSSATTPVSYTPNPAPAELPPPLWPPVPEKNQSPPKVTRPDVTQSLVLGRFFQDRGQYEEALRELEEAKGRDPDNADILTALQRVRSAKEAEDKLNHSQ